MKSNEKKAMNKSTTTNVFVKQECPCNRHFFKIATLIYDLDLDKRPMSWYQRKGITLRNTHVKYESSITYYSKGLANVNPFPNKPWILCVCSTNFLKSL